MRYKPVIFILLFLILAFAQVYVRAESQRLGKLDFKQVTITLKTEGGPCGCVWSPESNLSCCPAYSVSIDENGTVTYEGIAGVKIRGKHIYSIPVEQVKELVGEIYSIEFFSLEDRYTEKRLENGLTESIDHANATTTSIAIDGKFKSVFNFYGAPENLNRLQRKIYEASQVADLVGQP